MNERDIFHAALEIADRALRTAYLEKACAGDAALIAHFEGLLELQSKQGTVLTEDDRAFLRGVIAQDDAFAAIKGDEADSQALRGEGRWRVGRMRWKLGELQEAEKDYDQALSIQKQLAADLPSRPEFRQDLAKSQNNRGSLLSETGRPKEAEQDLDQALSILRQLATDFPNQPDLQDAVAGSKGCGRCSGAQSARRTGHRGRQ